MKVTAGIMNMFPPLGQSKWHPVLSANHRKGFVNLRLLHKVMCIYHNP